MSATLEIENLHVRVEGNEILKGVDLAVPHRTRPESL